MHLKLQFTEAGLAACLSAKDKGLKAEITHMAFGSHAYTPSKNQTSLSREEERIEISDYENQGSQIRVAGVFKGELEYEIREIGIFTGDTLLGVYSQPNKLLGYRTPSVKILQWFSLGIEALPTNSITVKVGIDNLNLIISEEIALIALSSLQSMQRELEQFYSNREKELMFNQKLFELSRKNDHLEAHIRGVDSKLHSLISNVFAPLASAQIDTMHRQMKDYYIN